MASLGERGEVTATSILQFGGRVAAEMARVLIRPSDLTLMRLVRRVRGDVLTVFSSGHFVRALVGPGSWIGGHFLLSPASLRAPRYQPNLSHPVIRPWNDDHPVAGREAKERFCGNQTQRRIIFRAEKNHL